MILGHPLNRSTTPLLPLPVALPYRRLMTLFPSVGRMDVHVVRVLQGTALSDPILLIRDASALNTPF
jgi:hypothetical protein